MASPRFKFAATDAKRFAVTSGVLVGGVVGGGAVAGLLVIILQTVAPNLLDTPEKVETARQAFVAIGMFLGPFVAKFAQYFFSDTTNGPAVPNGNPT